jgi:hypothetical protein
MRESCRIGAACDVLERRDMSDNDIHGIREGWKVKGPDGHELGTVEETTHTYIKVKSGLINTTHRYLPAATLAHVRPEMGEIGVSVTQDELESGDWSQPPLEPPRTEGAPLNEEAYEEADPLAAAAAVKAGPERPTDY